METPDTDKPPKTMKTGPEPRAVETRWNKTRKEWNFLVRRPFYMNLRLGATQNALWVGEGPRTIFNRFPLRRASERT